MTLVISVVIIVAHDTHPPARMHACTPAHMHASTCFTNARTHTRTHTYTHGCGRYIAYELPDGDDVPVTEAHRADYKSARIHTSPHTCSHARSHARTLACMHAYTHARRAGFCTFFPPRSHACRHAWHAGFTGPRVYHDESRHDCSTSPQILVLDCYGQKNCQKKICMQT